MARLPRVVVHGQPLHVIQRGNNCQAIIFAEDDYQKYLASLRKASVENGFAIHAYVLMTGYLGI